MAVMVAHTAVVRLAAWKALCADSRLCQATQSCSTVVHGMCIRCADMSNGCWRSACPCRHIEQESWVDHDRDKVRVLTRSWREEFCGSEAKFS